jgi:hypothetical protein
MGYLFIPYPGHFPYLYLAGLGEQKFFRKDRLCLYGIEHDKDACCGNLPVTPNFEPK